MKKQAIIMNENNIEKWRSQIEKNKQIYQEEQVKLKEDCEKSFGEGIGIYDAIIAFDFMRGQALNKEGVNIARNFLKEPQNNAILKRIIKENQKQNDVPSKDETDLDDEER